MFKCDNCGNQYTGENQLQHVFPNIPNLLLRLDQGGTVPAGECPACGALVYPDDKPVRLLILLDGGLVQDVLADTPGVEVAVLDQDTEGVDEEEIVTVVGESDTLRGTLQGHEVTVAPMLVDSAHRPVDEFFHDRDGTCG